MNDEQHQNTGELRSQYQTYDRQKCFIAYSEQAHWSTDLLEATSEVLSEPEFNLEPDYARKHFESDISLRQKALELIANARYGIYDLSWWRLDDKSPWQMPRNVFIELGIAIALNRPTLLLRNKEAELRRRKEVGLELPDSLQCLGNQILEFSGQPSLRKLLQKHLPTWVGAAPEEAWWNRHCIFGGRVCEYRETHPHVKQFGQNTLNCSIVDGADSSRPDFRDIVEDVLKRDHDINYIYLDSLSFEKGYNFLLCAYCQKIRSSSFAIYRITSETPPEAFIAIGITLALETQFKYTIPKILITEDKQIVPSLLSGYEVIEAKSDKDKKDKLKKFIPEIIRKVRKTDWKPKPLPFTDISVHTFNEDDNLTKNSEALDTAIPTKETKLSGRQRKLLHDAIIDAFPTIRTLRMMFSYELDINLDTITVSTENLREVVFNLIEWAESVGKSGQLIESAFKSNPGNLALRAVAKELYPKLLESALESFNNKPILVKGVAIISFEDEDEDGNITDKTVEITADDLDWEVDSADERQMGTETAYAATYYFDAGQIEWTVWEYPMGVTNYSDYRIEGGTLVKNFDSLEVNNEEPY